MLRGSSCTHATSRQVGVGGEQPEHLVLGERVEQLDAADRDVGRRRAVRVRDDVVVDLAGAEDQARDLRGRDAGLGEHRLEAPVGQVLEPAGRLGQAQQRLRRHHDQRALLDDHRLAAQEVEVLRRRRRVRDSQVALGGEREEALEAGGGVLGPRALVAVREQQREAGGLAPLCEARGDELVDDHLGALTKSPNCASQSTSVSGDSWL